MAQTIEELAEAALLEMDEATRQWAGEIADLLASVAGPADSAPGAAEAQAAVPPSGPGGPMWSDEGRANAEVIYRWVHGETVQGPDLAAELRYWLGFLGCEPVPTEPPAGAPVAPGQVVVPLELVARLLAQHGCMFAGGRVAPRSGGCMWCELAVLVREQCP